MGYRCTGSFRFRLGKKIAFQMYNSTNKRARLVGAVTLAKHGELKDHRVIRDIASSRKLYEEDFPELEEMAIKFLNGKYKTMDKTDK